MKLELEHIANRFRLLPARLALWLILLGMGWGLSAEAALGWQHRHERFATHTAIAHGAGKWVVMGEGGYVLTSPDGFTWTQQFSGAKEIWKVIYGGGQFVAIGGYPVSDLLTSPDGITWTRQNYGAAGIFDDVIYANGKYVAVGSTSDESEAPLVWISEDGIDWTSHFLNVEAEVPLSSVTYGNGKYLATTYNGEIWTSVDGTSWSSSTFLEQQIFSVIFADGKYIAGGGDGVPTVFISTDAENWTSHDVGESHTGTLEQVIYADDRYIGFSSISLFTSTDGTNWTKEPSTLSFGQSLEALGTDGTTVMAVGELGLIMASVGPGKWEHRGERSVLHRGIAYGAGTWVITGDQGYVLTSSDGLNWTQRYLGSTKDGWCVTYGGGLFVAAGGYPESVLHTSPDGITWTQRDIGTDGYVNSVLYANGKFLAFGSDEETGGRIWSSANGTTWTSQDIETATGEFTSGTYGNGIFVATTFSGGVWTSAEGVAWTDAALLDGETVFNVFFAAGTFVGSGTDGTNARTYVSVNGTTWTPHDVTPHDFGTIQRMTYLSGRFIGVGGNRIYSSPNGATWTEEPSPAMQATSLAGIATDGTSLIVAGWDGIILRSTVAGQWQHRGERSSGLYGGAFGNGVWVVTGDGGAVFTSSDRLTWTQRFAGTTNALWAVAFGAGKFVAAGGYNISSVVTSPDGITWTERNLGSVGAINDLLYANGKFIAVGNNDLGEALVWHSVDGITWVEQDPAPVGGPLYGVTFGNGIYVAVAADGKIWNSPDGTTWTEATFIDFESLSDVTYANGRFVAVGGVGIDGARAYVSTDGVIWNSYGISTHTDRAFQVSYGFGRFIATSIDRIFGSVDGITWTEELAPVGTDSGVFGLVTDGSRMMAVGEYGSILEYGSTITSGPPVIELLHYPSSIVLAGGSAIFAVYVGGAAPFTYQWLKDGDPILGAESSFLTLSDLELSDTGRYSVVVTNGSGQKESALITLRVENVPGFLWATGSNDDFGGALLNGVATDSAGNIYIVATHSETITFGGVEIVSTNAPNDSIFVAKLNSAGAIQWVRQSYTTNSASTLGRGVAVDKAGNVTIVADYIGSVEFDGQTITNVFDSPGSDVLAAKFTPNGDLLWIKSGGSMQDDHAAAVAADLEGNWIIAGTFHSSFSDILVDGNLLPDRGFNGDEVYVIKLDADGNFSWARGGGGEGSDQAAGIAVDPEGNVLVTGSFQDFAEFGDIWLGDDFALQDQVFVVKYDAEGDIQWARQGGYEGDDMGRSVATDLHGNVFITGSFEGYIQFDGGPELQSIDEFPGKEIFVVKFDKSGNYQWGQVAGSPGDDQGTSVSVDSTGSVFVTGHHEGIEEEPAVFGEFSLISELPNQDTAFVAKYTSEGSLVWARPAGGAMNIGFEPQGNWIVADLSGRCYLAGVYSSEANFDSHQLTDGSGSLQLFIARLDAGAPPAAPLIVTDPVSQTVLAGKTVVFNVGATGELPLIFQWKKGLTTLAGETNQTLVIKNVTGDDEGTYTVIISNGLDNAGTAATLTVVTIPAEIVQEPVSQTVFAEEPATFTVVAKGAPAPTYQWYFNNDPIPSATNAVYTIPSAEEVHEGNYKVIVTNSENSDTSAVVTLTVTPAPLVKDALDNTLTWTRGGDAFWKVQNSVTHDGVDALASGDINDDQQSWFETTVTGPGTIEFWWKISSEEGWDYLEFYVDGDLQPGSISGEVDWESRSFQLGPGTHTLRWRYVKDSSVSEGSDTGYVDQVKFTPFAFAANGYGFGGGQFILTLTGPVGAHALVEVSEDLETWTELTTEEFIEETLVIVDPDASLYPKRFYRAILLISH